LIQDWGDLLRGYFSLDDHSWDTLFGCKQCSHSIAVRISDEDGWCADWTGEVLQDLAIFDMEDFSGEKVSPGGWAWEIYISGGGTFLEDGCHYEILSEHELVVNATSSSIIGIVDEQRASEWTSLLVSFLHQHLLVVSQLDRNLSELLEEENGFVVVPNLEAVIWQVGGMRSHDGIRESIHFDPSLEELFVS
jgi:hypothetical protein